MSREKVSLDEFDISGMVSVLQSRKVNPDAYTPFNDVLVDGIINQAIKARVIDQIETALRKQPETKE